MDKQRIFQNAQYSEQKRIEASSELQKPLSNYRQGYGVSQDNILDSNSLRYPSLTKDRKRVTVPYERNNIHPLVKNIKTTIQNPKNLIEEVNDPLWVHGGFSTRVDKTTTRVPLPPKNFDKTSM